MSNVSHEEYLEELEVKIAEKMLELVEGDEDAATDRRTIYKRLAEREVEIDRLKEKISDTNKCRRELRNDILNQKSKRHDLEDRCGDLQVEIECLKAYNKELKCLLGQMRNEFNRFKELTAENVDLSQRLIQLSA